MKEPQKYEDLFFTDDFLFCKIMENDEHICRRVIEILLGIEVERIEYTGKQETLSVDFEPRGIRLDVVAKGERYEALPESFIVFICTSDPFGLGLPRYTVRQICEENSAADKKIDDKIHKVYYNSKAREEIARVNTEVRALLKFLSTLASLPS